MWKILSRRWRGFPPGHGVVNLHRRDRKNIGDMVSSPVAYFPFLKDAGIVDLCAVRDDMRPLKGAAVILGGGGLIENAYFGSIPADLTRAEAACLICWGAGHNTHGSAVIQMPAYLRRYDLAGVRDVGTGYEWTPCPSCMHRAFDEPYDTLHDIIVYQHPAHAPLGSLGEFPLMSNIGQTDIRKVLAFLGSGDAVLTSSYHGAYWATLLGKKVVVVSPFSSKFFGLRHAPAISDKHDWRAALGRAQRFPEALEECRNANRRFAEKVENLLCSHGVSGCSPSQA